VVSKRLLCSATPQESETNKNPNGRGVQRSGAWRRMSASRGLVFTASGLCGKQARKKGGFFCFLCHAARTRPDRRHATNPTVARVYLQL
jgi:hypothetical protein